MNIVLWVVQVLLAAFSLAAGYAHGLTPLGEAAKMAPWVLSLSPVLVRFIGVAELAAGVGLVLPALTRVRPILTPLAATGLALVMILAIPFHIWRGEAHIIGLHVVVATAALFVAWGRFASVVIAPRGQR